MTDLARRFGSPVARLKYGLRSRYFDIVDKDGVIAVTHCGKLGDFVACLPVASWLWKTRGKKIHFILARSFPPFTQIRSLLMLQPMTYEVTLADFPIADWEKGGRPYKHDPRAFAVDVREYYNLGFRRTPRRFVPEYVADEHGLGVDPEFKLDLGDYPRSDEILVSDEHMLVEVPQAHTLDLSHDILSNARRMAGAREVHVAQSGMFHILDLAGVTPACVYVYPHSKNIHLFSQRLAEHNLRHIDREVRQKS